MGSPSSDPPPVLRWARDAVTGLIAVGTLGGSIIGLWNEIGSQQNQYLVGGLGFLAVGAIWLLQRLLRRRFAPGSYLRKPSALDIGRRYLYGRDTDIENLLGRLADYPLIWLVGESGAGKSSLLEQGLVPRLREAPSFFPLYLDHWGADWIEGPRQGLRRALQEALDENLRGKLEIEEPVGAKEVVSILRRFSDELGLTPILIFDQFDDYQTRHRNRFLRGPERKVLSVRRLVARNPYWKEIAEFLEQGKAACVFVTRTDMQWGLECVRFREPEIYVLGRLGRTYAAEFLDEITAGDVVAAPERGWQGLRERFMDDLGADGWVLPIRMKLAFRGLAGLRPLSVGGYEREGGLTGLEALDVKRHVVEAARQVAWPEEHVRRLLLEFVESESRSKTVAKTPEDLASVLPQADRDREKLDQVLRILADADLVRQRIDPDQEGEVVWLLYHDYLSGGVLELDRRARRWQLLLNEASRTFEGAHGWGRWKALLSPVDQMRLLGARLRGQLRYGGARGYAAVSGVRWVINVWVVVLIVGLLVWRDVSVEREAQVLFNRITPGDWITEDERAALWSFSGARESVKETYFSIVLSHPNSADRFLRRAPYIVHSAFGLNRDIRRKLLIETLEQHCYKSSDIAYSRACSHLLAELPRLPEMEGVAEVISGRIVELMADTQNPDEMSSLAVGLGALGEKLPAGGAESAAGRMTELMAGTHDADHLSSLAAGLAALGEKVPAEAIEQAAGRIIEQIVRTSDESQLHSLTRGLKAVVKTLPVKAAETFADRIVEEMAGTQNSNQVLSLAKGLGALGDKLPADSAETAAGSIIALLADARISSEFVNLASSMGALGEKLPADAAETAAGRMVDLMASNRNPVLLSALAQGLGALGERLPAEAAETAASRLVDMMAGYEGSKVLGYPSFFEWSSLVFGLTYIKEKLPADTAAIAFARIIELISGKYELSFPLSWNLRILAEKLPASDAEEAFDRIVELMASNQDTDEVSELVAVLGALGEKLPADTAAIRIVDLIVKTQDPRQVSTLAGSLGKIGEKISASAAKSASDRIVELMTGTKNPELLVALAASLGALGERLTDSAAERSLKVLLSASYPQPQPPCASATNLIRKGNLQPIVELLKWPTCSAKDRSDLIERTGEVTGESFGREVDGRFQADLWTFIEWAAKNGYDTDSPPSPP